MPEETSSPSATETLVRLEGLLEKETQALIRLDAEGVQEIAQLKLKLCEHLAAQRSSLTRVERRRLDSLRLKLRHNLILLVHAREQVKNTVNLMTGRLSTIGPSEQPATAARLNVRG